MNKFLITICSFIKLQIVTIGSLIMRIKGFLLIITILVTVMIVSGCQATPEEKIVIIKATINFRKRYSQLLYLPGRIRTPTKMYKP